MNRESNRGPGERAGGRRREIPTAAWAAGLAGLWIASRGYAGIHHDARLYAAQALHRIDPQSLQDDLLFRYGTQDAYSLFSHLHAPLVRLLGLDAGTQLLLAFSHLLWVGALIFLAATLFTDWRKYLFSASAVALPAGYSHLILGYGEPFLTPRPAAEALVMIGLACFLRGRWVGAAAGLLISALLHPLMALAGWSVAALLLLARRPRLVFWLVPPAVVAPLAAWAAGIPPFHGLLRSMDAEWAAFVHEYNPVLFLSQWDSQDVSVFAVDTAVCLAALLLVSGRKRLFIAAALTTGLGGVLVNLVAADWLHLELFVQLQVSRLLWITHLAAAISWALLAAEVFEWLMAPSDKRHPAQKGLAGESSLGPARGPGLDRASGLHRTSSSRLYLSLALAWMAAALLLAHTSSGSLALAPLLSPLGLFFLWRGQQHRWLESDQQFEKSDSLLTKRLFGILLIPPLAVLLLAAPSLWFSLQDRLNVAAALEIPSWKALGWTLILPLALLGLTAAWKLYQDQRKAATWGLIVLVLASSLILRDRRGPTLQRWEGADFQLFSGLSSQDLRGRQVYWDDRHNLALWYGLGTPCYLTWTHRAVAPFFRPAAMEWRRRLHLAVSLWSGSASLANKSVAPIQPSKAEDLCRDPQLDVLILSQPHTRARSFEFDGQNFYRFDCQ